MQQLRISPSLNSNGFFQLLASLALLLLGVLGIGGILYNLLQVFERSVAGGLAALLALFIVGVCVWQTAKEISRPA